MACKAAAALRFVLYVTCRRFVPAPGRTQSVMQEVQRLDPGTAATSSFYPCAGHAGSLAACRQCGTGPRH